MIDDTALSSLLAPMTTDAESTLAIGETAHAALHPLNDTRITFLKTPSHYDELRVYSSMNLVVVSHVLETFSKQEAEIWLGLIKNRLSPKVILVTHPKLCKRQGWSLTDYFGMGFRHMAGTQDGLQVFSYAIENYQLKKDWLNSRFWANPQHYDKYRW
jgi:hypothetical protein